MNTIGLSIFKIENKITDLIFFSDLECGAGIGVKALAKIGADVNAIDACHENVEAVKLHADLDASLAGNLK